MYAALNESLACAVASVAVGDACHVRYGRLLPIPALAWGPLSMSGARYLEVCGDNFETFPAHASPGGRVALPAALRWLQLAPVNVASLHLLAAGDAEAAAVFAAMDAHRCHAFLRRLNVCATAGAAAAVVAATSGLPHLRSLTVAGDGAAVLTHAAQRTVTRLAARDCTAADMGVSRCLSLRQLSLGGGLLVTALQLSGLTQLTSIGAGCLAGCAALRSVVLPASLRYLGAGAFAGCDGLERVDMSATQVTLLCGALRSCRALAAVAFPPTLTALLDGGDGGACALSYAVALPAVDLTHTRLAVTGQNFMDSCSALASIALPASLRRVGDFALNHCDALSVLDLAGAGVEEVGAGFCSFARGLARVTLPASLRLIGAWAFTHCVSLAAVDMAATAVSVLGEGFGQDCLALSVLLLPTALRRVHATALRGCTSLPPLDVSHTGVSHSTN
jgi:hypothetical protein